MIIGIRGMVMSSEQVLLCDLTPKSLRQVHTVLAPYMYVVIISYFQNEHPDSFIENV